MSVRVLVVSPLDTTGRHGLAADIRAVETTGATAVAIPSGILLGAAPDSKGGLHLAPQTPWVLERAIDEAMQEPVDALFLGALPRYRQVKALGRILDRALPEVLVWAPLACHPRVDTLNGAWSRRELRRRLPADSTVIVLPSNRANWPADAPARAAATDEETDPSAESLGAGATPLLDEGAYAVWLRGEPASSRCIDRVVTGRGTSVIDYPALAVSGGDVAPAALAGLLALGIELSEAIERARAVTAAESQPEPILALA